MILKLNKFTEIKKEKKKEKSPLKNVNYGDDSVALVFMSTIAKFSGEWSLFLQSIIN